MQNLAVFTLKCGTFFFFFVVEFGKNWDLKWQFSKMPGHMTPTTQMIM